MTQAQTLQDIYSKIADIYDKFCEGVTASDSDPITNITQQLVINENAWTSSGLIFANPDSEPKIGLAQMEINSVLNIALELARDESTTYDATALNPQNELVPIPKGSPIMLLPKLIRLLVLYKAPLKFLMNVILDYIKEVVLDHIKRRLEEKRANLSTWENIVETKLIKIPKNANAIVVAFDDIPSKVSKRFEPSNLNKSIVDPAPSPLPDLSKYLLDGLGTFQSGISLEAAFTDKSVFWDTDVKLEYSRQKIDLPSYNFVNLQRYGYLYIMHANTCSISFLST